MKNTTRKKPLHLTIDDSVLAMGNAVAARDVRSLSNLFSFLITREHNWVFGTRVPTPEPAHECATENK